MVEDYWKKSEMAEIGAVLNSFHFSKLADIEKFPNFIHNIKPSLGVRNSFNMLVSSIFDHSMDSEEKYRLSILSLAPQGNRTRIAKWKTELDQIAGLESVWINMIDHVDYFERIVDVFCELLSCKNLL